MKELLTVTSEHAILLINAMALLMIVVGTIEAFLGALKVSYSGTGHERRAVWLRYARWLVGGLTFQLAADIIESSISTNWDAIARLASVALIRTFLNHFLERDLAEYRRWQREPSMEASSPSGAAQFPLR